MDQTDHLVQSQQTSIQNLKRQVDQLAKVVAEKEPGKLLSNTEVNLKETTMVVTLCSGKVLDDPVIKSKTKPSEKQARSRIVNESEGTVDMENSLGEKTQCEDNQHIKASKVKVYVLPILFPQKKKTTDEQYQKFVEILKKLQMNMPFSEVLANIPMHAKFLKCIVSSKKMLEDFAMVSLTKECSVVVQNRLPVKMKDLESFTVPCQLENLLLINAYLTLDLVLI